MQGLLYAVIFSLAGALGFAATAVDLNSKSSLVAVSGMKERNDETSAYPKIDSCTAAIYAKCGVALRGRNHKGETSWPLVPDGSIEATDTRFIIHFTSPTISGAAKQCVKDEAVKC